ncbi:MULTISPECIES: AAA family ATPase [Pseudanabaena]|uniref:AAA family ATPase n=1 Tax=Pseudanabaena TaxID=1152 RepID=UPI00247835F6|nr:MULTISPECIES: AAA family ATPase [Pseudanabaena]MEA5485459.1 AAA family ATPase [Pseudanabaena sp. CCNP1317]WGS73677.1 AAA family ATPase [Pseudanabaena galeata CCNP1313]
MSFNPKLCRNESEVESKLIVQYLLPTLGYDASKWHQEVALGSIRLDFLALTSQVFPSITDSAPKVCVVMEAKHPKHNLDSHVRRLSRYLTRLHVVYGVLTNGKDFRIYELVGDQVKLNFQCQGTEITDNIEKIKDIIGRDKLAEIKPKNASSADKSSSPPQQSVDITPPQSLQTTIAIPNPKVRIMKTIAIYHNKGGVGKTTTTINLAAAISRKGLKVLIIDLDSQANTTYAAGLMKFDTEEEDTLKDSNIYNVVFYPKSNYIPEIALKSTFTYPPVDVIPAHINLIWQEARLVDKDSSKTHLVKKLELVKDDYDVVLIDTPPSLNLYAKIALIACDYLIIPSDLKPFANEGLRNVKNFVEEIDEFRTFINKPAISILGVLPSKILTNANYIKATLPKQEKVVEERYGFPVLETRIFQREDLSRAIDNFIFEGDRQIPDPKSIFDFKPDSISAAEFEELANEVLEKVGLSA